MHKFRIPLVHNYSVSVSTLPRWMSVHHLRQSPSPCESLMTFRALAMAVSFYLVNKNYSADGVPNVEFAERDARIMREYLLKTFGFKPENIFFEENATFAKFSEIFGSEAKYQGKLFD